MNEKTHHPRFFLCLIITSLFILSGCYVPSGVQDVSNQAPYSSVINSKYILLVDCAIFSSNDLKTIYPCLIAATDEKALYFNGLSFKKGNFKQVDLFDKNVFKGVLLAGSVLTVTKVLYRYGFHSEYHYITSVEYNNEEREFDIRYLIGKGTSFEQVPSPLLLEKFAIPFRRNRGQALIHRNRGQALIQGDAVGRCPICMGSVLEQYKSYSCSSCDFVLWKNIAGKKISTTLAQVLLSKGKSKKLPGFRSKKGKRFSATIILNNGKAELEF